MSAAPRQAQPPAPRRSSAGHWLALALLVPAGLAVGASAARALSHRVPLSALLGWRYPVWLALLAAGGLAVAASARRELCAVRRAPAGRAWLPLRAAFASCVLGAGVFLLVFPVPDQVWLELSAGLVGGLFAALLLLTRGTGRGARALDFLAFQLCLTLVLAEPALRAAGRVTGNPLLMVRSGGPWQFVQRQLLPPLGLWWGFPSNSEGFYDEEFLPAVPGERVVATIGDSFSIGTVHHSLHFTTVAERALGLRVDNYGAVGIGALEYLDLLTLWVAPRRPELVVVDLFVGNDLRPRRFLGPDPWASSRRPSRWLSHWIDRENLLVAQVPRRILRLARSRPAVVVEQQPGFCIETREQLLAELPWMADPTLERPSFADETFFDLERGRAREIAFAEDCEELFGVLRRMRAAAGDIPLAVMLIPDEFQVEDPLWDELLARYPELSPAERDRPQRLLGEFLAAEGIPALDLLPLMRAVAPMPDGRRHLYHRNDTHFNARGNQVAGEALAEFLRRELGL